MPHGYVSQWLDQISNRFRLINRSVPHDFIPIPSILPVSVVDVSSTSGLKPVIRRQADFSSAILTAPGLFATHSLALPDTGTYDVRVYVETRMTAAADESMAVQVRDLNNVSIYQFDLLQSGDTKEYLREFAVNVFGGSSITWVALSAFAAGDDVAITIIAVLRSL